MASDLVPFINKELVLTIRDHVDYLKKEGGLPPSTTAGQQMMKYQAGSDMGFNLTQSDMLLHFVQGRLAVSGKGLIALMVKYGYKIEWPDCTEKSATIKVTSAERGTHTETFTEADARRANLWGKAGPWTQYPKDMLRWKAAARAVAFFCPEVTSGAPIVEDYQDNDTVAGPSELQQQVEACETIQDLEKLAGKVAKDKGATDAYSKRKIALSKGRSVEITNRVAVPVEVADTVIAPGDTKVVENFDGIPGKTAVVPLPAPDSPKPRAKKSKPVEPETVEAIEIKEETLVTVEEAKEVFEPAEAVKRVSWKVADDETLLAARDAELAANKKISAVLVNRITSAWFDTALPEDVKAKRSAELMAEIINQNCGRDVTNGRKNDALYGMTPTEGELLLSAILDRNFQILNA